MEGGDVLTAAGIDLCLHLIRRDHGAEIANRIARQMVVAAHRDGGQAQFIEAPVPRRIDDDSIASTVQWVLPRLGDPLTVGELARRSHLSPRQFSRRFRAATGTSPGGWLLRQRLQASPTLLERSDASIEEIGRLVGLPSAAGFRRHFRDAFGVPPSSYRRNFQSMHRSDPRLQRPPPLELSLPHGRRTCRSPLTTRSNGRDGGARQTDQRTPAHLGIAVADAG